jgi:hypothetical protein
MTGNNISDMADDYQKKDQNDTYAPQARDAGDFPLRSMGQIADVNTNIVPYIKAKYFKRAIAVAVILVAIEAVLFSYCFFHGFISSAVFEIAAIPIVVAVFLWNVVKDRVEGVFMEQFAAANNFSFQKEGLPENLYGSLFSLGYGRSGRDMVSGSFNNLPLSLFNYSYTIGSGKYSHTYHYTVLRLDYSSPLPPILLQVKGFDFGESIFDHFSKNDPEKIQLEGDFGKYFTLYGKTGFETEILEIFDPDFMEKICDEWNNFSLEFIDNYLYVYSCHVISTKAELDSIYSLAKYLAERIEPLAERMKSDLLALESSLQSGQK